MNAQPWLKSYPAGMRWDAALDLGLVQSVLEVAAERFGPLPALEFMDKRITYAELEAPREFAPRRVFRSSASAPAFVSASICRTPRTIRLPSSVC